MPRYYCDYCDTHLTHDSFHQVPTIWTPLFRTILSSETALANMPSVRKQHNSGYKHKTNVREYYQQFEQQQTQLWLDLRIKEHHGQVGGAFNPNLVSFPGNLTRPALLPTPLMPNSAAATSSQIPGIRPMPFPGSVNQPAFGTMLPMNTHYIVPPGMPSLPMQGNGQPMQGNGGQPMQGNGQPMQGNSQPMQGNSQPMQGNGLHMPPNPNGASVMSTQPMYQTTSNAPGSTAP